MKDFIGLARLRFAESEAVVNLSVSGSTGKKQISPMILLPFIENAFKHGLSLNGKSVINIPSRRTPIPILFSCANPGKDELHHMASGGIGLENVKRRLMLFIGKTHLAHRGWP